MSECNIISIIPEWIAAIGTVLASCIALFVSYRNGENEKKGQSNQVSAWREAKETPYGVHIMNASRLPIYNVVLSSGLMYGAGPAYSNDKDAIVAVVACVPPWRVYRTR